MRLSGHTPDHWRATAVWTGSMLLGVVIARAVPGAAPTDQTHTSLREVQQASSTERAESQTLDEVLHDLKSEVERLKTESRSLDQQYTALLSEPVDGHRHVKLLRAHGELIRYLNGCVSLIENVDQCFGELVSGEGQVDPRARVVEARGYIDRFKNAGSAGVIARRLIHSWMEKDLQAVEALNADWPEIRDAVGELVRSAGRIRNRDESSQVIERNYEHVLMSATRRVQFADSRLGRLCRQLNGAVNLR